MKNRRIIVDGKIIKYIGNILMLLSVGMIIHKLRGYRLSYGLVFEGRSISSFVIITLIYTLIVIWGCVPWKNNINFLSNEKLKFADVALVYTKSNLYKYIPGNVFQYVGRNELAIKRGLKHKTVALATVMDVLSIVTSSILLTILLSGKNLYLWINNWIKRNRVSELWILLILVIALVIFIISVSFVYRKKADYLWIFCNKKLYKVIFRNFIIYSLQNICNASLYIWIFGIISNETYTISGFFNYIGIILIGFIVGFITPGAPGGVGIREAVMLFFLSNILQENTILMGTIIMRIISVVGDTLAFLVVSFLMRVIKRDTKNELK